MQTRHLLAGTVAGLAAFALAGCGSSSDSPAATVPADAALVVYAGPGIKFDQSTYTTSAGSSVKIAYDNRDAQRHTLDIVSADKTVIGKELVVGKSGDIGYSTYDLPAGTYSLECLVPGHDAMRATLVVK